MTELPGAVPEIPVADIGEAIKYYEGRLGFETDWADIELGLAGISSGHCRLFLSSSRFRKPSGKVGPVSTWLNMESKAEVDNLYQQWSSRNATVISAPESKPWGLHEFTAADHDGNTFRIFYDFATPEREKEAARVRLAAGDLHR
ncbi:MAG TPA: VOC family protein [Thermoanaerobaculia bacterium]|nr:VOC family protein [Thermoanaerobaculia bacterium]